MVKVVTSMDEFETQLQEAGNKLVVVDFYANWCPPCKRIAPVFEQLSNENPEVVFLKVDVDKCPAIARKYKISAMPTFKFFKHSTLYNTIVGGNTSKITSCIKLYSPDDAEPSSNPDGTSMGMCNIL